MPGRRGTGDADRRPLPPPWRAARTEAPTPGSLLPVSLARRTAGPGRTAAPTPDSLLPVSVARRSAGPGRTAAPPVIMIVIMKVDGAIRTERLPDPERLHDQPVERGTRLRNLGFRQPRRRRLARDHEAKPDHEPRQGHTSSKPS
jgi:hypothetical protein